MSESHVFVLSWLLPHLCDQCCPSPAQIHFQLKRHLVGKCWVYWDIWGHFCAFAEVCDTMGRSVSVPHPNASLSYLLFLIEGIFMLIIVLEVLGWTFFPALSLFLLDSPKGPEFHTFGKIWQVGHQPRWSGGTWSSVAPFRLVSVFCIWGFSMFSPELPHSSCMKTEAFLDENRGQFWMIFVMEPLESEEPVSCSELRELSPAVSLHRVLERSTVYILPSTLKASEFTSDKSIQIGLPVPVSVLPG